MKNRVDIRKYNKIRRRVLIILCGVFAIIWLILCFGKENSFITDFLNPVPASVVNAPLGDDFVRIIDVGQGDCIQISSNESNMFIDSGCPKSADTLCKDLRKDGVRDVDLVLLTHLHDDHYGGLERMVARFFTDKLILPDLIKAGDTPSLIVDAKKSILAEEGEVFTAKRGIVVNVGDFEVTLLAYYPDEQNENDRSVVAMAQMNGKKFLLTGDASSKVEKRMIKDGINLDCDVLKVGHHGSRESTSDELLNVSTPEYAAISCGTGNQYDHPHDEALKRLENHGVQTFRTDKSGDITFYVLDDKIKAVTEK